MERKCIKTKEFNKIEYIILDFLYDVTGQVIVVLLDPYTNLVSSCDIDEIKVV